MSTELSEPPPKADPEEPPPIFGTWNRLYAVVVANTLVLILLLYLFSRCAGR